MLSPSGVAGRWRLVELASGTTSQASSTHLSAHSTSVGRRLPPSHARFEPATPPESVVVTDTVVVPQRLESRSALIGLGGAELRAAEKRARLRSLSVKSRHGRRAVPELGVAKSMAHALGRSGGAVQCETRRCW